jgi:hypothetical protein
MKALAVGPIPSGKPHVYGSAYLKQIICHFIIIGYIVPSHQAEVGSHILKSPDSYRSETPECLFASRFALLQPSLSTHSDDVCEML